MSIEEQVVEMRKKRMTYQAIADVIGKSRSWVGIVLNRMGHFGHLESYPALRDPNTFVKGDEEVAKEVGLSVSTVALARRRLGLKHKKPVDLRHRRDRFVNSVFTGYVAGPNFSAVEPFVTVHLSSVEAVKLTDFYLESKNGLSGYSRFARSKALDKLKLFVTQEIIDKMLNEGVICPPNH